MDREPYIPRWFASASAAAALLFAACTTGSSNTVAGAAVMSAAALGAAAAERATGGCIALCTNGTSCNPRSGLCEPLPCRSQCERGEHCELTFSGSKCVPGAATGVVTEAKGTGTVVPVAMPINPPDSSGPPIIVPAAEQQPPK